VIDILTYLCVIALICFTGIVRKVKISYLKVGHTHDDIDAIIGNVATHLRSLDVPTFSEFQEACRTAIKKDFSNVLGVDRLIGISDYDSIFSDFNSMSVQGMYIYIDILICMYIYIYLCIYVCM